MYREQDGQAVGFGVGVLAGALVGAGLALLFAPKAGAALRADLGDSVGEMKDAIATRYQDLAARAGVELDNIQERVERMTSSVEADARDFVSSVRARTRRAGAADVPTDSGVAPS